MVVIVGKVFNNDVPVPGARVKVTIWDKASGNIYSSSEMIADENSAFQYDVGLKLHQSLSIGSEMLIAAWDDDSTIEHTHNVLGTGLFLYEGEALIVADVNVIPKEDVSYILSNSAITINQREAVAYTPVFYSPNQMEYFHGVSIFPQSRVTAVYMESGGQYIDPYSLYFTDFGNYSINTAGENTVGQTITASLSVIVSESEVENILTFDDINIDAGLAFFAIKNLGIKDNIFNASIFSTEKYSLESAEFFFDEVSQRIETDFSSFGVSITLPSSVAETRIVRMETFGYLNDDTELTQYIFEQQVNNYYTVTGAMSIVYDEATSKHTASIDLGASVNLVKILWQVKYESVFLERILSVDESTQIGLIDILYEEYLDPSAESITFEALRNGAYTVSAYAINTSGVYTKISEVFEIGEGVIPDDDIVVGETVQIACSSLNYATPIMEIYRLSRDGYVSVAVTAMTQSFDTTYISDYVIEHPDSFYVFRVAGSVVVKKVGSPSGCVVAVNTKAEFSDPIPYIVTGIDGTELETGVLTDTGYGVYYAVMTEGMQGILTVGNTQKVI